MDSRKVSTTHSFRFLEFFPLVMAGVSSRGRGVRAAGFTFIELMMVVAVVAILGAIALPSYKDYVTRGRIPDATSNLAAKRVLMEQYFQDNRTYVSAPACTSDATSSKYFTFSCPSAATATAFTLQAVGTGAMTGFTFTIDQTGARATSAVPSGWSTSTTCWVTNKGGTC